MISAHSFKKMYDFVDYSFPLIDRKEVMSLAAFYGLNKAELPIIVCSYRGYDLDYLKTTKDRNYICSLTQGLHAGGRQISHENLSF